MPEKYMLYNTQTAVKTFTFLTSNERNLIPKLLLNPDFWNLQRKGKFVQKLDISSNLG